ncbi:ATP-binding protein [Rhodoferax sp.]|uniref:ATP-binding protein n=1 Tax=Rhodoferax sp. TaxID=50421 RepID=UPI0025E1F5D1|nr:ATP-binding protein [Rhodoferax sp.]
MPDVLDPRPARLDTATAWLHNLWKGLFRVKFPSFSLRQTLMFGVAAGILLPALFFAGFQITSKQETEVALRVEAPLKQYADVLSRGMAVAVWNLDRGVAIELVEAVMRNPDVVSVTVTDEFGESFVKRGDVQGAVDSQRVEEREITYNGARVGKLMVMMSTRRVEAEARADLMRFAGALLLQVGLAFAFIWPLFNTRIVKPMLRLRESALRLARGDLSESVASPKNDEMGQLANALDGMRIDLGALLSEREQKTLALQRELEERARTEQALRDSQAKFAAIFDASPVAMSVSTFEGEVQTLDVNTAWGRVFGMDRAGVIGSNGKRVGIWKDLEVRKQALDTLQKTGELSNFQAWMRRGLYGAEIYCELSGRVVTLAGERVLIMAFDDITEQHRYDENILQLNATLEHRVQERTQELTDALGQLRAAQSELVRAEKMSALGSLVAGIAHELNTPIGNSLTVASTLQDHASSFAQSMSKGLTRSRLDEFVTNTQQGAGILMRGLQHAAELVSSFKQVAVDQTSLNRRSFELHHTVSEILLTLGPTIRKSPHVVTSDIPLEVVLNSYPGPLGQILTNLINNALIHAFDENGEPGTIHISACLDGDDRLELRVSDNGRGIPPAHLARVFDPFFTTRLGQGGSGLGLNIVYNLVTKTLGGTIDVSNVPGSGACFRIRMPLVAPVISPEVAAG